MQPPASWLDVPEKLEKARANYNRFSDLAARYGNDASLRARIDGGDTAESLAELGIDLPPGFEARIVADTPGTVHFVLPPDPNVRLSDEALNTLAGGKTVGSIGSIGSAGSFACSTGASTISSVGSIGTAGTTTPSAEDSTW